MSPERPRTITESFTQSVLDRLIQSKPVRRAFPKWGRIHVDRRLPFLFLYRRPPRHRDEGTERLLLGEAAYILAPGEGRFSLGLSKLIQGFAEASVAQFGAFLLFELWSSPPEHMEEDDAVLRTPAFRVWHRGPQSLAPTVKTFEASLQRIRIGRVAPQVDALVDMKIRPPGLPPMLSEALLSVPGVHILGLEVRPIYRSADEKTFPLVLRDLHRAVSRSMKQALVGFARTETHYQPAHYQSMGRRAVVKAVWEVDRILADVSNEFDFLLSVTPVNVHKAWKSFERDRREKAPRFGYRPLPLAPFQLKRRLFSAPIEKIEDPELGWIFRQKQNELDRQLSALVDRDTRRFLYGSLQIYGGIDDSLLKTARELLDRIPAHSRERRGAQQVNAESFAVRAREEIQYFKDGYSQTRAEVEITTDVTGLMVSRGKLLIASDLAVPSSRLEALVQHEVGTHILTYVNGKSQPFRLLSAGLAGYDELQEGLAVLSEYLVDGLSGPRLRLLAARVVAVQCMIDGATFVDTFRELDRNYEFSQQNAFSITTRVFRGGGLTKDAAYLRGLVRVLKYIHDGGSIETLLVGKLGVDDVPVIDELLRRKILHQPPLRPRYLDNPAVLARLQIIGQQVSPLDLLVEGATQRSKG